MSTDTERRARSGSRETIRLTPQQLAWAESTLPWIQFNARRIIRKLGKLNYSTDMEDLAQEGFLGAMQAAQSYDIEGSAQFGTFARKRIRGQMIDHLRHNHLLPPSYVRNISAIQQAENRYLSLGQEVPPDEILTSETGLSLGDIKSAREMHELVFFSLDLPVETHSLDDPKDLNSAHVVFGRDSEDIALFDTLESLSEIERKIVLLRYAHGYSFNDISIILDTPLSEVRKLHRFAKATLRQVVEHVEVFFDEPVIEPKPDPAVIDKTATVHANWHAPLDTAIRRRLQAAQKNITRKPRNDGMYETPSRKGGVVAVVKPDVANKYVPDGYRKLKDALLEMGVSYDVYRDRDLAEGLTLKPIGHGGTIYISNQDEQAIRTRLQEQGWDFTSKEKRALNQLTIRSIERLLRAILRNNSITLAQFLEQLQNDNHLIPLPEAIDRIIGLVLDPFEQTIVKMRIGLTTGSPMSFEEIGRALNRDQSGIARNEKLILRKLQSAG